MSVYFVDFEADGPCPGLYSALEVGIVKLTEKLDQTFWRNMRPVTELYQQSALDSISMTRQQTQLFGDPQQAFIDVVQWVESTSDGRATFVSDNPGFDWQWMNYGCHHYVGRNPFGFSSRRIGDFFSGLERNWNAPHRKWKKLRTTAHTHNALDDAMGNAGAFIQLCEIHSIALPK